MARNFGGGKFKRMPWVVGALVLALSLMYLVQARTQEEGAKNIILLVGDGMGLADVTAARMFKNGPGGEPLAFETLPEVGYQRTYSANSTLTDSAAAASAWATGEKFANGEISFKTNEKRSVRTILEIAREHGKATGLVTTKTITDATPAAFGAHVFSRDCQNEIARQYLKETRVDVLMGGGLSKFSAKTADDPLECPTYGGDLLGEASKGGYALVRTNVQMEKALGQNPARLLGLFATGNMTKESEKAEKSAEPSLEGMTRAALSVLQDDPKGFFLLVEGAQIDTSNHDNDYAGQLGEVLAFERASKAVLEWLEKDPGRKAETLLIVMADHETGGFAINGPSDRLVNLGEVIEPAWTSKGHTGVDTVLWAQGPGSEKLGRAAIENTEIFRLMAGIIGAR